MDPISIIVMALAGGAAAALKPMTEQAIKDAYAGIKGLIQQKYSKSARVDVAVLENDPASKPMQAVIKEDLEKTDAGQDKELLRKAEALIDAIQAHAPNVPGAAGLDMEDFKAASLAAKDILVKGSGVAMKGKRVDISGPVQLENIHVEGDTPPKK